MTASKSKRVIGLKVQRFLVFLFLAVLFWMLTKFSKENTATISANLQYTELPNQTLLADGNPEQIDFDITGSGFEMLYYRIKGADITMPLANNYSSGSETVTIPNETLLEYIQQQLPSGLAARNISMDQLSVKLHLIHSKKVAVFPAIRLEYEKGYYPIDSLKVRPDSVTISGPKDILKAYDSIPTENTLYSDVDSDISVRIGILENMDGVRAVSPKAVEISQKIAEFTQKEVMVPITLRNVPPNTVVRLIPKNTTVSFNVAVSRYQEIEAGQFQVVCDFSKRDKEESFMVPKLLKYPKGLYNLEITDKKIDYLIFE